MEMHRAYSLLHVKKLADDERVIEGIASTPSADRVGDVVEPMGAEFKIPMPLLWQHRTDSPVGHVEFAKPTRDGIPFRARIAQIEEAGELKNLVDKAWQAVKAKLVGAVSIGFIGRETEPIKNDDKSKGFWGATRFKKWEWLELSLVTIPANQDATINVVRSIDAELLAASGKQEQDGKARDPQAGVTAPKPQPVVKATKEGRRMAKKTLAETISAFEATRAAKAAARDDMMEKSAESGETLDAAQTEEYDGLVAEIAAIDAHLKRLNDLEASNKSRAAPVNGANRDEAAASRAANGNGASFPRVSVKAPDVDPTMGFTRYVLAMARAHGNRLEALEIAKSNERWQHETPDVEIALKVPVPPGTTTDTVWAGPLVNYQILVSAFAEYLRPLSIIGRVPGLTRVPFKVRVPRQTAGATVNWVGEAAPKPLTSLAFDSITLDFTKIAGIIPLTEELIRSSSPSAETLVRNDLAAAIVQFMDSYFVDPSKAATGISPASITNGVTALTPTGTTGAALMSDINRLIGQFLTNNLSLATAVFITTQQVGARVGSLLNSFGQPMFPTTNAQGGTLLGIPVVTSENVPSTTGSPTEGYPIILVKADDILLADDGQVTIDASREATLQMETAPDSPATASTVMQSLWQQNMVAIKAERFINWTKRRSTAVSYLSNAVYTG
jgi:HK97 family phage major capsid protein/HK97 family phage prohead protease